MANSERMEHFDYAYKVFYKKADVLSTARKSRIPQGFFRRTVKAGILGGLRHLLRLR